MKTLNNILKSIFFLLLSVVSFLTRVYIIAGFLVNPFTWKFDFYLKDNTVTTRLLLIEISIIYTPKKR